jgi:hypothetical protein
MVKRIVSMAMVALAVAAMMVALALPAFAQGPPEDPGVETGPEHANSLCSYSGLNDDPDEEGPGGGRTQSYGQLVRKDAIEPSEVKSGPPSPGFFCNAHNFPLQEGGPEE